MVLWKYHSGVTVIKYFKEHGYSRDKHYYFAGEPQKDDPDFIDSHLSMATKYTPREDDILYPEEDQNEYLSTRWDRQWIKGQQMQLFQHYMTPESHEVSYASGTERGRTHFPLLLSIANNDSMERYGIPLTPSHDLSHHSLKFVNNLQRKGIVGDDPYIPDEPTNNMTFENYPSPKSVYNLEPVGESEVKKGKESLRKMLRTSRNLSSQFNTVQSEKHQQLELDL